jgi:hypothetical protein
MIQMKAHEARALLHVAGPFVGNEVRKLVRELARIGGVQHVAPSIAIHRQISINYDPNVVQAQTIANYVRRRWAGARLV